MAKYLIRASYVGEGVVGLLKEGGTSRRKAVEKAAEALGGRVESMYYAFGETDAFVVVELPGNVSAAAASLVANATGTVNASYTVLITPEELDEAAEQGRRLTAAYRAPGQ
ncbi:MAG: GYD domain-containing protein [Caldilineaceae bacterium]|nr:GYD domain-containing protein [Caldilineaceae bacterium]HRJ44243.1 GYD domain-containing protein [Caldilineaceae bacterium]